MLGLMAVTSPALAGPPVQIAAIGGDEGMQTAAVMPGIGREARVAQLPRPLSAKDAETYARILKLQAGGQWAAAEHELRLVKDETLKGHVLARRYLDSAYKPRFQDLRAWMAEFADLPQAEAVWRMATAKPMKNLGAVKPPVRGSLKGTGIDTADDGANWEYDAATTDGQTQRIKALKQKFRQALRTDETAQALAMLTDGDGAALEPLDVDALKVMLAADHFASGRDAETVAWASQAAERSGDELPTAHWLAGLAHWRSGHPELARRHFEEVGNNGGASSWMVAAGALWAARANLVAERPEMVNHWLEVAATYPRTFYGLLARHMLGYETAYSWENRPFTETDADQLLRTPGGRRALALLQLGERDAAEEELRKFYPRATKALKQSMLALAQVGDMPTLAVRLGAMAPGAQSDAAAFPIPTWNPKGGWVVDKALVYAFVRQESSFNPKARSRVGAAGLMQIMPKTATSIAGRGAREKLNDPEFNLGLGQRYLATLLNQEPVSGNLFMLAAAYNAGPGNLTKWLTTIRHNDDPLLFIESIPSRETRSFVERVMSNYWVYTSRMGQSLSTLDQLAAGAWPTMDGGEMKAKLRKISTR
ncbi:MAG: lytic transglycosylase domain-containing protein [Magnetospirillum sp.]|nr:lytic transglycosylase domain-containing protein [Magnetospirillum sp.]